MSHLFLARSHLCQPAYVPHAHSIMYHACTCRIVLGLPCLALPCLLHQHCRKKKSAVLYNKYRKQEALDEENEVLDSKAFNGNPSVQPSPVFEELHCPRRMPLQHSEACSDPALSVAVVLKKLRVDDQAVSTIYYLVFYSDLCVCRSVALYLGQYPIE